MVDSGRMVDECKGGWMVSRARTPAHSAMMYMGLLGRVTGTTMKYMQCTSYSPY